MSKNAEQVNNKFIVKVNKVKRFVTKPRVLMIVVNILSALNIVTVPIYKKMQIAYSIPYNKPKFALWLHKTLFFKHTE